MGAAEKDSAILDAEIVGLDTHSGEESARCERHYAHRSDVLAVAGGDGTMSLVINAVDLEAVTLAFLPFGAGNALTHTLAYRGDAEAIARHIHQGRIRHYDLIDCGGLKKAFMASIGLDGEAIRHLDEYRRRGYRGLNAHARAMVKAVFSHRPAKGRMEIDGAAYRFHRLTSCMIVKQPFFGMGLKVVPRARWNDGFFHSTLVSTGLPGIAAGFFTSLTIGNKIGRYRKGKKISVSLNTPQIREIDGGFGRVGRRFEFSVLPGVLKLKH